MRKVLLGAAATLVLFACGTGKAPEQTEPGTQQGVVKSEEGLVLQEAAGVVSGSLSGEGEATFSSREVESGVYRVEVRLNGMTLSGLVDPASGVSAMDGFADGSGQDTQ